jgi:hypothetical protein
MTPRSVYRESGQFVEVGTVKPDPRGRLTLAKSKGKAAKPIKVDSYRQYVNENGEILLVPLVEVPAREMWVHENPEVKARLLRAMDQVAQGQVRKRDFSDFPDD